MSEAPQHAQAWMAAPQALDLASQLEKEEIISAILVGLPAAGHRVIQVLPTAIAAYDAD